MPKLTYTNERGQSIVLGDSPPLLVTKLEGLGGVQNTIHSYQAPYQDGLTVTDSNLEARVLTIEGVILDSDKQQHRKKLVEAFNPKLKGILRYEKKAVRREAECRIDLAPAFPSNYGVNYQEFLVSLICHNPFWLDTYYESREMSYLMGGIKFRLTLPTSFSNRGFTRKAISEGDVETPVEIEFIGPATNPTVTNITAGEFIKVNQELGEKDVLTVSTAFGEKYVKINGENAFHYIDLDSTFWQLQPGDNILSYTSNNDSINTKVTVKWKNRYVGL